MYKLFVKPFLFLFPPETAHHITMFLVKFVCQIPFFRKKLEAHFRVENPKLKRKVMGLDFPNPVGLAAGFDKNASSIDELAVLGFGFIEIGTVTPKAQAGNPKPRLFRLPKDQAIINRMGFNNVGVENMVSKLEQRSSNSLIIGGNIGKNKITPNEEAYNDYEMCFEGLYPFVDYFVVNVSSPNTPNLRELQEKEPLLDLLHHLTRLNLKQKSPKPILLKISPDLTREKIDDIITIVNDIKLDGLILTNTTTSRAHLKTKRSTLDKIGNGGLSGSPLFSTSNDVLRYVRKQLPKAVLIGVGGINSAQDAKEKLAAGADLIQIYSGLIYQGPSLVKQINQELANS